ncbi:MAG: hydrogenase maturation protease [Armatimonadetes bacterium]|nr:hydrogenase maturation protease [Armatimonadota bacterium]
MSNTTKRIVVLGVGSELHGDDSVGVVVARRLQGKSLPENVEVVVGHTGGLNLLFDMEGADWAIVVDAVDFGGRPGEICVFEAEDADLVKVSRVASLHHVSLADVLELGRETGITPRVTVVGIQPGQLGFGQDLSAEVAQRVEAAVQAVVDLVAGAQEEPAAKRIEYSEDGTTR